MLFPEELVECPTIRPDGSCSTDLPCCHWLIWSPAVRKLPLQSALALRSPTTVTQLSPIVSPLRRGHTDSLRHVRFELHCVKNNFPAQWGTVGVRRPRLSCRCEMFHLGQLPCSPPRYWSVESYGLATMRLWASGSDYGVSTFYASLRSIQKDSFPHNLIVTKM